MLTRPQAKKLDILSGIARGIIADKLVNRKEIGFFKRWIQRNAPRNKTWPWDQLDSVIKTLSFGKKPSRKTKQQFLLLMQKISGLQKLSFTTTPFSTRLAFPKRQAAVTIKNKSFCLTGLFKAGRRGIIGSAIEQKGGVFHERLSKKNTDYLVVGIYASPSWPSSHLGRKLEAAKTIQRQKQPIKIVSESNLIKKLGRGW